MHFLRSRLTTLSLAATLALGAALVGTACGSSDDAASSSGGASSSGESSGGILPGTSSGVAPDALKGCATDQIKAEVLPLDVVVLFDTSDSMNEQIAPSLVKYKAASDAIASFLNDPRSAGIGAGLQVFPRPAGGTSIACPSGTCPGAIGPCSLKACDQFGPLVFCSSKAECANGKDCSVRGRCANAPNVYCTPGTTCPANAVTGFDQGACVDQAEPYCTAFDSCAEGDYATLPVAIAPLPGAAAAITAALAAQSPKGNTPTSAALKGVLGTAAAYATANPGHTVAVILVTDGAPNRCGADSAAVANLAAAALGATPSVRTFVIGVFPAAQATAAKAELDPIASKGGTKASYIVTQGATTTQQLADALGVVRGVALPCDYDIPTPTSGAPDFSRLNVEYLPAAGQQVVYPNRKGKDACDADGGWYYDVDPTTGATPRSLTLCPTTCDHVKSQGGQVNVVLGCQTIIR